MMQDFMAQKDIEHALHDMDYVLSCAKFLLQ